MITDDIPLQPPFTIRMDPNSSGKPRVFDSGGRTIAYGSGFYGSEVSQLEALVRLANEGWDARKRNSVDKS